MKKITVILSFVAISISLLGQKQNAETAFVIPDKQLIPEGIAYDASTKCFFIGSIQKSKIVRIDNKGKVTDFVSTGSDGLRQALGMKVLDGKLWVCNNSAEQDTANKHSSVHIFDIATAKLTQKFELSDGKKHLFNDLYQTRSGDTYITDSDGGAIYVVRKGSTVLENFLPVKSLVYPNGITADANDSQLIVSTGSGLGIVAIDIATQKITPIRHPKYFILGMDGLYLYKGKLIGVQNVTFPEAIIELTVNESRDAFTSVKNLISDHPKFDSPTTGVIVNDIFYFISNAQISQLDGKGGFKNPAQLVEPVIMKIKLN